MCFGDLEVRLVRPCFICGGWPDATSSKPEHHFTIREDGTEITLCHGCWIEEIVADQGDLKERLKIDGEHDVIYVDDRSAPDYDKFCPACDRRLALLKAMASRLSDEELETWRANRR